MPGHSISNMRYFLDTEFNGFGGAVLSLALQPEDLNLRPFYVARPKHVIDGMTLSDFVAGHVIPVIDTEGAEAVRARYSEWPHMLRRYLKDDASPHFVADWPDDLSYLLRAFVVSPGEIISMPRFTCECVNLLTYPTRIEGAVRHNALWDARALRAAYLAEGALRRA